MKPILECKGLSKKYNKSAYALHNLNLTLNHGADYRTAWSKR